MPEFSSGTVTFLFTDIEGSTALLRRVHGEYGDVLAEHQRLLRTAFEREGGEEIDTQGDAFLVVFRTATEAVRAAIEAQQALAAHDWPEGGEVRVRIGIHTGEARLAEQRYVGLSVHRGARVAATGHGGQIVISQATYALLSDEDAALTGVRFRDLGEHRLKDFDRPMRLHQVLAPDLRHDFPSLRTAGSRRRRRRVAVTGALLVLAGVAAGVATVLAGSSDTPALEVKPNSLVKIDPRTNRVANVIDVGNSPGAIVFSAGSLWVLNEFDRTVSRVQPETGDVTSVPAGLDNPCCLASDKAGGVWVSGYGARELNHLDPITLQPDRVLRLRTAAHGSGDLARHPRLYRLSALGGGSLWLVDPYAERVRRVSVRSGKITRSLPAGALPFAVTFADRSAWVSSYGGDTVFEIRAADEIVRAIAVPGGPAGVAVGARTLWVIAWSDGKVRRLDKVDGATTDVVDTGQGPAGNLFVDIVPGFGAVWSTFGGASLVRIDRDTSDVTRVELGHRAGMIAVGADGVWVTVQGPTA